MRGNGNEHVARIFAHRFVWNGSGFLDWLVKHDFPVECERGSEFELQTLCYRCNSSKGTTEACRFPHWCQICGLPINTGKVVGRRVKFCPDHRGIGGGTGKPEHAGLRSYTRARSTGTHVGVYDGTEAGMDAAGTAGRPSARSTVASSPIRTSTKRLVSRHARRNGVTSALGASLHDLRVRSPAASG
jgi:hypothetical protein